MHVLAITSTPGALTAACANAGLGELSVATTLAEGLARLRDRRWHLVLVDVEMDGVGTVELLPRITALQPHVVLLTRTVSLAVMIEGLKHGAMDVLPSPPPADILREVLGRCRAPAHTPRSAARTAGDGPVPMIGESTKLLSALRVVARVAPSSATVLLQGESGTGKELMARLIHDHGPHAAGPFVAVNCAAIPAGLLESELFGHEKGAFTGAAGRRMGRFERAAGGTLFLDEIGDMEPSLQAKILRVLQEREFERVGGEVAIPLNVRIIAATHCDLAGAVSAGRFREDLFYRLAVVELRLPPLREREGDVALLSNYFVSRFASEHGRTIAGVADETIDALQRYSWPGNIRQLRNVLERAVLLADGPLLLPTHLPPEILAPVRACRGAAVEDQALLPLEDMVRSHILRTLALSGGQLARTADLLKIHRNTLRRKLHEYGIAEPTGANGDGDAADASEVSATRAPSVERVRRIPGGSELRRRVRDDGGPFADSRAVRDDGGPFTDARAVRDGGMALLPA